MSLCGPETKVLKIMDDYRTKLNRTVTANIVLISLMNIFVLFPTQK